MIERKTSSVVATALPVRLRTSGVRYRTPASNISDTAHNKSATYIFGVVDAYALWKMIKNWFRRLVPTGTK